MSRVVLDTNFVVSALLVPTGTQASIVALVFRGQAKLILSEPVLSEYFEVMRRPRFQIDPRRLRSFFQDVRKVASFVTPTVRLSLATDEPDNRFLECAQAGKANYLVSGNARHAIQ